MKMTGTWASCLLRLSRRQVSNPSAPGIRASRRMMSGSTRSTIDSACSPSRATSTVMPACSIASVSRLKVSGESSTTSTIWRVSFLRMAVTNSRQRGRVSAQVECIDDGADARDEVAAFRQSRLDLAQLVKDAADMSDLAEADQLVEVGMGRSEERRRGRRRQGRSGGRGLVDPFDVEQRVDLLQELAQIDRLHHAVVVKPTRV